jgi:D-psicose/D-tagatose/L-ribulose 3-epimerase
MQYGMNLLLWSGELNEDMLPLIERLKKLGYDGVELPMFDLDVKKFATWGKHLDNLGLARTGCTVRGPAENPISADPKIRAAGVENNRRAVDCCQAAGARTMIGPYHSALGEFSGKGPTADEWKRGVESMRQVAEHAGKAGVMLGIEYLNRFETYLLNCAADTVRFVKEVNHPSCRMMYDTFHANIEEKNAAQAIKALHPHFGHVHISESDRGTPGTGMVHWDESFKALREVKYDGWLVIEAFGRALPALAAATKVWRDLFPSPDEVYTKGLAFMKSKWSQFG